MNLEILVEERSAEQALRVLLPRIVPDADFEVRVFQGKTDLLKKLPDRLKAYANWITRADTCLVVLVDRAQHMNVDSNRSRSFQVFRDGVRRLVVGGTSAAQG